MSKNFPYTFPKSLKLFEFSDDEEMNNRTSKNYMINFTAICNSFHVESTVDEHGGLPSDLFLNASCPGNAGQLQLEC